LLPLPLRGGANLRSDEFTRPCLHDGVACEGIADR